MRWKECAVASDSAFRFAKRAVTLDFLMVVKAPFVSPVVVAVPDG